MGIDLLVDESCLHGTFSFYLRTNELTYLNIFKVKIMLLLEITK